jgi:hypothetical protein
MTSRASCQEKSEAKESRYESPKAVFQAFRDARQRSDAQQLFGLLTVERQKDLVVGAFYCCVNRQCTENIKGHKEEALVISRILEKYLDSRTLNDDYFAEYKKKHGIDIKKLAEEDPSKNTATPAPPRDDFLWHETVAAHVKDKKGFYVAVANYFHEEDVKKNLGGPVSLIGELQQLDIQDDTAEGSAKETLLPDVAGGEAPLKPGESPFVHDKTFKFRRINGGWLLDSP